MTKTTYRQGDVLIQRLDGAVKPGVAVPRDKGRVVLAYGELTGHAHAIGSRYAKLFRLLDAPIADTTDADRLLRVTRTVSLDHEEHSSIRLPPGDYLIRHQREYQRAAMRTVQD
jgi:hypothetical protein